MLLPVVFILGTISSHSLSSSWNTHPDIRWHRHVFCHNFLSYVQISSYPSQGSIVHKNLLPQMYWLTSHGDIRECVPSHWVLKSSKGATISKVVIDSLLGTYTPSSKPSHLNFRIEAGIHTLICCVCNKPDRKTFTVECEFCDVW